jgi:hypothetical protein
VTGLAFIAGLILLILKLTSHPEMNLWWPLGFLIGAVVVRILAAMVSD